MIVIVGCLELLEVLHLGKRIGRIVQLIGQRSVFSDGIGDFLLSENLLQPFIACYLVTDILTFTEFPPEPILCGIRLVSRQIAFSFNVIIDLEALGDVPVSIEQARLLLIDATVLQGFGDFTLLQQRGDGAAAQCSGSTVVTAYLSKHTGCLLLDIQDGVRHLQEVVGPALLGIAPDGLQRILVLPGIMLRKPQFLQLTARLYLGVIDHRTLGMDKTQYLIITVSPHGVGTVGGLVVGRECTRQVVEVGIGTSEDELSTHLLVGIAVTVEIAHQRLFQRVVKQFLTTAVLLLQRLQLLSHLRTVARAARQETQDEKT